MSSSSLDKVLLTEIPGFRVIYLSETPSTNLAAEELLRNTEPDGPLLLTTDSQTAGLGRRDHVWFNRPGEDIAATFVIPIKDCRMTRLMLPLATGLAAALALEELGVENVDLKWPNDVMLGGKKAGGILCKSVGDSWFIAGIGLNHAPSAGRFPAELAPLVSAIADFPSPPSREESISALAGILLRTLCSGTVSEQTLLEEWSRRSHTHGRRISVKLETEVLIGLDDGLGPHGELMLRLDSGESRTLLDCLELRPAE